MILADSDVLIDFLAGTEPGASRVRLELEYGQLFITPIHRFELLTAAGSARQSRLIRQLLDALPCVALDDAVADRAAELHQTFAQDPVPIPMNVCLIASVAILRKAQLLTRERAFLDRIPGVAFAEFAAAD
jgi:predicted nucleic acid-binding protein